MATWLASNPARQALAARVVSEVPKDALDLYGRTLVADLLATHLEVNLDWFLAEAVLESQGFTAQLAWVHEQCGGDRCLGIYFLPDLLEQFPDDGSRRKFLAYYIGAWQPYHWGLTALS